MSTIRHRTPADQLPAWQALAVHAKTMPSIATLFNDTTRAYRYQKSCGGVLLDFAKQRVDDTALDLLLDLARQSDLKPKIHALFDGKIVNISENRAARHTDLRAQNPSDEVRAVLDKMAIISDKLRTRLWRGIDGRAICDVVNIGVGGSDLGARMVCDALGGHGFEHQAVRVHFVASMDGEELHALLMRLDPATTLFIVASKSFSTEDTMANARTALAWLLATLQSARVSQEMVMQRHIIGVSANAQKMHEFGIVADNQLVVWQWVGGRFSLWSAMGLAICVALGMEVFLSLADGARMMDRHFLNTDFKDNLPVLLGLLAIYNSAIDGACAQVVLPYDARLKHFVDYLSQLEMESLGKSVRADGTPLTHHSAPILWGDIGSNAQHAFYQLLHQGTRAVAADFILTISPKNTLPARVHQHRLALANALAQSHVLAFGHDASAHHFLKGNQPSNTLILDTLDAQHLGALIALYEHKVYVMSVIWQINAFDQWGVEHGKVMAKKMHAVLTRHEPPSATDGALMAHIWARDKDLNAVDLNATKACDEY